MKKLITALVAVLICGNVIAGTIGLPVERLALPAVSGTHLVCVWDNTANAWLQDFEVYDHAGTYDFQLPSYGKWYWVGLWDSTKGEYVFGKWVGHFPVE